MQRIRHIYMNITPTKIVYLAALGAALTMFASHAHARGSRGFGSSHSFRINSNAMFSHSHPSYGHAHAMRPHKGGGLRVHHERNGTWTVTREE